MKKYLSVMGLLLGILSPLPLWADDASDVPVPDQPSTAASDSVTLDNSQKIIDLEEDIISRQQHHNDASLKYNRAIYAICVELMGDKIALAKKNGDESSAMALQAQLDGLKADRDAEWDEDIPILQDKYDIAGIQLDALVDLIGKKLEDRSQLSVQAAATLDELQDFITQLRPLMAERLDLEKRLITARNSEDFATAESIHAQLKVIRQKMAVIVRNSRNDLLQKAEKTLETSSQNL